MNKITDIEALYGGIIVKETLLAKIRERRMMCGVIGLGYVGLPLAVEKASAGFRTIGFDVQPKKVEMVNAGVSYIGDVDGAVLAELVKKEMLAATNDFEFVTKADFIAICVPTPLDNHGQPEMRFVKEAVCEVAKRLRRGQIVVLESTTYPGTTEELVRPILEEGSGLLCGKDFYLGFSPERVDPGNAVYKTKNTPKIVGAVGAEAAEVISEVYRSILEGEVFSVSSPAVAEMEKLLENSYRNVNIALVNELAKLCEKMRISIWEVIDAASTKPYGFQAFYPGLGPGGHCIPLDPGYLSWKAREYGFRTTVIDTAVAVNEGMVEYCVSRVQKLLSSRGYPLSGSGILLLGMAYKKDIADYRESPAVRLMEQLEREGARVQYHDPWLPEVNYHGKWIESIPLTAENIRGADAVIVTSGHTNIDYRLVAANAKSVLDTVNAMRDITETERKWIEVL